MFPYGMIYPFKIKDCIDSAPSAQIFYLYFIVNMKFNLKVVFTLWCGIFWSQRMYKICKSQFIPTTLCRGRSNLIITLYCMDVWTLRKTNFRPTCYLCQKALLVTADYKCLMSRLHLHEFCVSMQFKLQLLMSQPPYFILVETKQVITLEYRFSVIFEGE